MHRIVVVRVLTGASAAGFCLVWAFRFVKESAHGCFCCVQIIVPFSQVGRKNDIYVFCSSYRCDTTGWLVVPITMHAVAAGQPKSFVIV